MQAVMIVAAVVYGIATVVFLTMGVAAGPPVMGVALGVSTAIPAILFVYAARLIAQNRRLRAPAAPTGPAATPPDLPPPVPVRPAVAPPPFEGEGRPFEIGNLNLNIDIDYVDGEGHRSQRRVTVHRVDGEIAANGAVTLGDLYTYCHTAKAARTFRADRIETAADADGVIIDDLARWLVSKAGK